MNADTIETADAQRQQRVVVLETPHLPFDSRPAPVEGGHPPRGVIQTTAARYAEAKLPVSHVSILRMWHPTDPRVGDGSCAIVEIRTPAGATRRVVGANEGDPPAWEGLAVSEKFGWNDFRPDSDVNCGLDNAGIRVSLL